ncbi:uncharacterized protein LOC6579587 [Drosophila mojavensis]|uniref:Uncharacterized protein n=1 Tax=Drosophila mojavensis TaxID=7230 RepID=B4KRW4_DROMO|nr:uncharacterized protein LOC6579587 [Drosophila mojavensis]EDW09405.1 uncharacterized protein Dmoj_GI19052 [Drosophila mojavensis]
MKFSLVLLVVCALAASVQAQTTAVDYVYKEQGTGEFSPSSYDYSSYYYPSYPSYPSYQSSYPSSYYYYEDDVTTPKPFKHQFLSMLFKKG